MIRRLVSLAALCATPALAEVAFEDRSDALPRHLYEGGWEHFVGMGRARAEHGSGMGRRRDCGFRL